MKAKINLQVAKEKLLSRISKSTLYRMGLAKKFPTDAGRNIHSSTALYQFYEYVNGLSLDHAIFPKIQSMEDKEIKILDYRLSRYGFGNTDPNPDKFLYEIITAEYINQI